LSIPLGRLVRILIYKYTKDEIHRFASPTIRRIDEALCERTYFLCKIRYRVRSRRPYNPTGCVRRECFACLPLDIN
jgi:hypothetical protein